MNDFSKIFNRFTVAKQIPVFRNLSWFELHTIAQKCTLVEYKKGGTICREGTPPDAFYCLVSGRLQTYHLLPNGRKDNVEIILRGMHFGIISLFTGLSHSQTVEALNDSIVFKIPKEEFLIILKKIPHLGLEFSQSLSHRIRNKVTNDNPIFQSYIISIYSPVLGSGTSTYALNLALNLEKETGKKVILVTLSSNTHPAADLRDLVGDYKKIMENITRGQLSIDLLPVVFDPQGEAVTAEISQFVSALVNDYHYVIVDLPNDMDSAVMQTLTQSDIVQLITSSRPEDLRLTRQIMDALQEKLKEKFNSHDVQILMSGKDIDRKLSSEDLHKILNHNVSAFLPSVKPEHLHKTILGDKIAEVTSEPECDYARALKRIARRIGGVLVGLALGGGAALGVAHIGVIRVLEKENIPIDVVVGSSMGALIASIWAIGNNAEQLEKVAREFEKKANILKLFDPVFPKSGFIGGRLIKLWLKKHLGDKTFYDTKILLKVISYDLIRRQEHVIEEGNLVDAVRESVAIPGVIEPILKGDQLIIDGGVLNPLPINVLMAMGIKKIIAVNVLQSPSDVSIGYELTKKKLEEEKRIPFFKSPLQFIGVRLGKMFYANIPDIILRTLQASEYVIAEQNALQANIVIHPDLAGINWFELYEVDKLIKRGEEATRKKLPEIKKLVQ